MDCLLQMLVLLVACSALEKTSVLVVLKNDEVVGIVRLFVAVLSATARCMAFQ